MRASGRGSSVRLGSLCPRERGSAGVRPSRCRSPSIPMLEATSAEMFSTFRAHRASRSLSTLRDFLTFTRLATRTAGRGMPPRVALAFTLRPSPYPRSRLHRWRGAKSSPFRYAHGGDTESLRRDTFVTLHPSRHVRPDCGRSLPRLAARASEFGRARAPGGSRAKLAPCQYGPFRPLATGGRNVPR
jgi:hypothetical protein